MSFRNINNITILAEIGEQIELPTTLIAFDNDNNMVPVTVEWEDDEVDTSEETELIFEGKVSGYVHKVLCSVHVTDLDDNPESVFPEGGEDGSCPVIVGGHCIDQFGLPKRDIQTADIPDIDDYQYFKAKVPRTQVEEMQLKQLRELLADKIILARDINHMRNAIVAIEEYLSVISGRIDELEDRVDKIEDLMTNMVVDANNIGSGAGVFSHRSGGYASKILNFRRLQGIGAEVRSTEDSVIIEVEEQAGCGVGVEGDSFTTCGNFDNTFRGTEMGDGYLKFTNHFGMKMVNVKSHRDDDPGGSFPSMLWVMGMGKNVNSMPYAGRMLKAANSFVIEMKNSAGTGYSGLLIDNSGARLYNNESTSKINSELVNGQDVYTDDGAYIPDRYR